MGNILAAKGLYNNVEEFGSGSSLDTSAQPCQSQTTYQKRARSKFFSVPLATRLADHAKLVPSPEMEKSYRNSIYCAGVITQGEGKLTTKYCGNRWCMVCNRIRTARAIEAYKPIVEGWGNPYMVTLTLRNVPAEELPATLDAMVKGFAACTRAIRRTHGLPCLALRKLECTYNMREGSYHPHYHVIVDGQEQAELLRDGWLHRFAGRAELVAQDVKPCGEGSLQELFKYFTKLTTRTKDKRRQAMPIDVLHTIFRAMRGRRVWQPCGFKLPKRIEEAIEGEMMEVAGGDAFKREDDRVFWQWDQELSDWIDDVTGELLSEYVPSDRFRAFVESILDTPTINQVDAVMAVPKHQGDGDPPSLQHHTNIQREVRQ